MNKLLKTIHKNQLLRITFSEPAGTVASASIKVCSIARSVKALPKSSAS
jgi:hypothetical protein